MNNELTRLLRGFNIMRQSMRRRRSLPWIQRWSRPLIGAIAIAGALLTAYLAITKLTGGEAVCSANAAQQSCSDVLNSRYGTVFGLPLSLFGCLAYLSMATFALSPLLVDGDRNFKLKDRLENWTWLLMLAGSTAMTAFSGYLMYVLAFDLKAVCWYCISSALFALSMFILTIFGRDWEDIGQIFFTSAIVVLLTLVGALGIYNIPDASARTVIPTLTTSPEPPNGWEVTTESTAAETELAKHLTDSGAKMYGAFWCPHCFEQKQLFGKEAAKQIPYNECAPEGNNPQTDLCRQKKIQSFPTWEINGKFYTGAQELEKLAKLSKYSGNSSFKYKLR
jgi:uncharacterized membrane protein/glutaredoxin